MKTTAWIHPFTRAGFGPGPFEYISSFEINQGLTRCHVCGRGIKFCNRIGNADGSLLPNGNETFIVGNDCVERTEDTELIAKARKREDALRQELHAWVVAHESTLRAKAQPGFPHRSAWDYMQWALGKNTTVAAFCRAKLGDIEALENVTPETLPSMEFPGLYYGEERIRARLVEVEDRFARSYYSGYVPMKTVWVTEDERFPKWLPFGNCEGRGRKLKGLGLVEKMERDTYRGAHNRTHPWGAE